MWLPSGRCSHFRIQVAFSAARSKSVPAPVARLETNVETRISGQCHVGQLLGNGHGIIVHRTGNAVSVGSVLLGRGHINLTGNSVVGKWT